MRGVEVGTVMVCLGIACAGGYVLGRAEATSVPVARAVTPEVAVTQRPTVPVRGMVCVRTGERDEDEQDCASMRPALSWCASQLDRCESRGMFRRHDWPETTPVELPKQWTSIVQDGVRACGFASQLELIECSEYPCVAAFRVPSPAGRDATAHLIAQRDALQEQLDACAPLQSAFPRADAAEPTIVVHPYDAPCEQGREPILVVSALDPGGPAHAVVAGDDIDERLRWSYRRGDDVAAAWNCAPP